MASVKFNYFYNGSNGWCPWKFNFCTVHYYLHFCCNGNAVVWKKLHRYSSLTKKKKSQQYYYLLPAPLADFIFKHFLILFLILAFIPVNKSIKKKKKKKMLHSSMKGLNKFPWIKLAPNFQSKKKILKKFLDPFI